MITSLVFKPQAKIADPRFAYLKQGHKYIIPTAYCFAPGLNVLVGKNGSGKSSLLKFLAACTFAGNSCCGLSTSYSLWSQLRVYFPGEKSSHPDYSNPQKWFDIRCDYRVPHVWYTPLGKLDNEDIISSVRYASLKIASTTASGGETSTMRFNVFLSELAELKEKWKGFDSLFGDLRSSNSMYREAHRQTREYLRTHSFEVSEPRCSIFMDEPDAGLDVYRLKDLYGALRAFADNNFQVFVSVHSPVLIEALRRSGDCNLIEMSPNYIRSCSEALESQW